MTDRYMKVVFTIIALALIWLGVKDTRLEPVVSAQNQGWDAPLQEWDDNALALGLPNPNLALPRGAGYRVCVLLSIEFRGCVAILGDYGALYLNFSSEPNCGGTVIGTGRIYSEGATNSFSHASYLFSEAALMAYAEMAQRAAASGQRVTYHRCGPNKTFCVKYVAFRGLHG